MILSYPNLDLYWLLTGRENLDQKMNSVDYEEDTDDSPDKPSEIISVEDKSKNLKYVLCFFEDGTFEKFEPRS
jgi:hypothetical protein